MLYSQTKKTGIKKGIDIKLNVKPAYLHLIHQHEYEGPCRTGPSEQLTTEFDIKIGKEKFENFKKDLKTRYPKEVNMLSPAYLTWTDEFILRDGQMKKVLSDVGETDFFLFDGVFHQFPAVELAVRFKKPVGIIGCCASTDASAYLKSKGLEAYGYIDHEHANRGLSLLRVKKTIRNTNVLVALKNDIVSKGVLSTITDIEGLKNDLGVRFTYINTEELLEEVHCLTKEDLEEAERITKDLVDNAEKSHIETKHVLSSVKFYLTVKKLLVKYECNAFTVPCFEICATQILHKEKYTFCLAHSLLKEEGIPSACEADINVLMAINVLTNLTKCAPHMGNTHPLANEEKRDQSTPAGLELVDEIKGVKNLVSVWHAVPTRKMKGINKTMLPYDLRNFTHGGWGATIRYDFNRDINETITLLRFLPTGKKMFAVKGKIIAGAGFNTAGCATGLYFQVKDVKDFFRKEQHFGHHYAWVYGDYIEDLKDLGEVLGVEVVTA